MSDLLEHDWDNNILTFTGIRAGLQIDYDEALVLFEELEERLQDMERRSQQMDEEAYADHLDTERTLTRIWYE